ncbi:flagellar type III secretion system pore protein FliP [Bombella intestini]|uniref:flagellar type III secretion system pore protein FliP n=1 Tax=Bombella intestini TaxID=1539051 RepID=UPI001F4DF2CE|nr:flagellar type III secretion system pore protein FliP [Bombella intestini]
MMADCAMEGRPASESREKIVATWRRLRRAVLLGVVGVFSLVGAITLLCFLAHPATAQSVTLDMGKGGGIGEAGTTSRLIQLTALVAFLSLAPSLLVMMTAFTRIIITLSLLRSAIGAQGTPPNMVLVALALILTLFVMQPTLERSWQQGIEPLMDGRVEEMAGLQAAAEPFRDFMIHNARPNDVAIFYHLAGLKPQPAPANGVAPPPPWRVIVPAFMVGELSRGFEMGFLLYLPFLVIDLVTSSVLMSLGMMMLPPPTISLPFKLIFFVLVDGFQMVSGGLVRSFGGG